MEALIIAKTDDTPQVHLDKTSGKFEFSGKSLPEDVSSFYKPIFDWLDAYSKNSNDSTIVEFKMTYFNTASSKVILDVLMKLEENWGFIPWKSNIEAKLYFSWNRIIYYPVSIT